MTAGIVDPDFGRTSHRHRIPPAGGSPAARRGGPLESRLQPVRRHPIGPSAAPRNSSRAAAAERRSSVTFSPRQSCSPPTRGSPSRRTNHQHTSPSLPILTNATPRARYYFENLVEEFSPGATGTWGENFPIFPIGAFKVLQTWTILLVEGLRGKSQGTGGFASCDASKQSRAGVRGDRRSGGRCPGRPRGTGSDGSSRRSFEPRMKVDEHGLRTPTARPAAGWAGVRNHGLTRMNTDYGRGPGRCPGTGRAGAGSGRRARGTRSDPTRSPRGAPMGHLLARDSLKTLLGISQLDT